MRIGIHCKCPSASGLQQSRCAVFLRLNRNPRVKHIESGSVSNDKVSTAKSVSGLVDIAERFVAARTQCRALKEFPGELPLALNEAYACQNQAIELWPDKIGGWKVGLIGEPYRSRFRVQRLTGPVFELAILHNRKGVTGSIPIFADGFAAVEAEFVFKIGNDAPVDKQVWSHEEAAQLVASMHAGVEIASSPLSIINDLGPASIISDFGNNNGLIVGAEILNWQNRPGVSLTCQTLIDQQLVGKGNATSIPGGPLASLAFALEMGAKRGHPLKRGQYVCTGAATGVHKILIHQRAVIRFDDIDEFLCVAVAASTSRVATGL